MSEKNIKRLVIIIEIIVIIEIIALLLIGEQFMTFDQVRSNIMFAVTLGFFNGTLYYTEIYTGHIILIPLVFVGLFIIAKSFF